MTQCIQKQIGLLAAIESESHFLKVSREMLCADLVPRSHDAALKQGECGLDRVCVDVPLSVNLFGVIDSLVFGCIVAGAFHRIRVCAEVIRHQYFNISRDVIFNEFCQCARLHIFRMEETKIAATLPDSENDFFIAFSASTVSTALLSANIGFVDFYRSVQ